MDFATIATRIIVVFIASILFGIDRQRSHKPIGFGTYTFVSVGTTAITVAALVLAKENIIPIMGIWGALLTGVGFLGAGALVKNNDKTFGFTTASGVWMFAILGILIGSGEYMIGTIIYGMIWAVILIDKYLERRGMGSYMKKLTVKTNAIVSERDIRELIDAGTKRNKLISMNIDKKNAVLTFIYQIEGSREEINKIPNTLFQKDWFESCSVD